MNISVKIKTVADLIAELQKLPQDAAPKCDHTLSPFSIRHIRVVMKAPDRPGQSPTQEVILG
jgi:hypothetical protein